MENATPVHDRLQCFEPITERLDEWYLGDREALDEVVPLLFDLLRNQAGYYLRQEASCFTLQPTALVNEAFLRLVGSRKLRFESRAHFYFFMSGLMRRVLVEHARVRLSKRAGAGIRPEPIPESEDLADTGGLAPEWLLALENALHRLEVMDPMRAQVVSLRFFGGLKVDEIAEVMGTSTRTVKRSWQTARLWLAREIGRPVTEHLFLPRAPSARGAR